MHLHGTAAVRAGDLVADRVLLDLLGRGGEGEVWRARRADGSISALKLLRPDVLPEAHEVRRRGEWLVRIDHPGLVHVSRGGRFTAGPLTGWGFVEMDLVEGPSLLAAPPLPDALERLAAVADGLDLLHAGAWSDGIPLIHRDVKPGNLIATDGGWVLVDPSTMRGLDTADLTRVGTPAYLAPEVVTGRFGPLADVYSLSATAAALLTGARGQVLSAVLADPVGHGLPAGVCAGLRTDPAERPGTCAAVLAPDPPRRPAPPPAGVPTDLAPWPLLAVGLLLGLPVLLWQLVAAGEVAGSPRLVLQAAGALLLAQWLPHAVTGRPALGLFAPPWAWGALVAGLEHPDAWRRRRWLADTVAGTLLAVGLVVVALVAGTRDTLGPWAIALPSPAPPGATVADLAGPVTAVAAVALAVLAAARLAAAARSPATSLLVRALLLPVRLLGAIPRLLIGGGAAHPPVEHTRAGP